MLRKLYNKIFKKEIIQTDDPFGNPVTMTTFERLENNETATIISDDEMFNFLDSPKQHPVESLEGWSGTLREQILEFYDKDDPVWMFNVEQSISNIKRYLHEVENELR